MKPVEGTDQIAPVSRPTHPGLKVDSLVEALMRGGSAFAEKLDHKRDAHDATLPEPGHVVEHVNPHTQGQRPAVALLRTPLPG